MGTKCKVVTDFEYRAKPCDNQKLDPPWPKNGEFGCGPTTQKGLMEVIGRAIAQEKVRPLLIVKPDGLDNRAKRAC